MGLSFSCWSWAFWAAFSGLAASYDLFQRLNAGGTPANSQELRNKSYFDFVKSLADHESFLTVLAASDDQIERQRHMEYASRFLVYTYIPYDGKHDVEDFINGGVKREQAQRFKSTFDLLGTMFGSNALRRIDGDRPRGRVSLAAFECIAVGIGKNIDAISARQDPQQFIRKRVEEFWTVPELQNFFTPGLRGTIRIQRTIPFGERFFAP